MQSFPGTMRLRFESQFRRGPLLRSDLPLRILVLSKMASAIIGRGGGTVKLITRETNARIDVQRKEGPRSYHADETYSVQAVLIYGSPDNCSLACQKILEVMQQESNNTNRGEIPLKMLANNKVIGRIIGKNGSTIKHIMEATDTKIAVSRKLNNLTHANFDRVITIQGSLENICKAEKIISQKLRDGYRIYLPATSPPMMFPEHHQINENYYPPPPPPPPYGMYGNIQMPYNVPMMAPLPITQQVQEIVHIYIPTSAVGAIIGPGGSTVRDMMCSSGADIRVEQINKDEPNDTPGYTHRKVVIDGDLESQSRAQYLIFEQVNYVTYTASENSRLKVEIFVPSSQVGRIIGKGGQTVRELQLDTRAIIKLSEGSDDLQNEETTVHIIGDYYSTQAAQARIRQIVNRSHMANARRPPPPGCLSYQHEIQEN